MMTDHLVLLLLPSLLRSAHADKILFDAKMSTKIRAAIEAHGGIPVEERSAHCYLETRMIKEDCLFGCEYSGHFFYRDLNGGDDGMYAALSVIEFLGRAAQPLTALRESLPPLHLSPDLRITGDGIDFEGVRQALRARFKDAHITEIDGVRVEVPGAWVLVRPSVSENKVSFRFEGDSRNHLDSMMERVMELLPQCRSPLARQIARWRAADPASK
jgi:phosphomannomutase